MLGGKPKAGSQGDKLMDESNLHDCQSQRQTILEIVTSEQSDEQLEPHFQGPQANNGQPDVLDQGPEGTGQ